MRTNHLGGVPGGSEVKNLPASPGHTETWVQSLGQEDSLEKETATHSIIFAWIIPWIEESGGLQCMGLQRVRLDLGTKQQNESLGKLDKHADPPGLQSLPYRVSWVS